MKLHHERSRLCAAALSLACLLAACGGGSSETPASATEAAPQDDTASAAAVVAVTTSTSAVPVMAPATYEVSSAELLKNNLFSAGLQYWGAATGAAATVASELRSGGSALKVMGVVTQKLDATALVPGRAYTLTLKARNLWGGTMTAALRLREKNGGSYRSYACKLTSTAYQDCRIDFTAPAYVQAPELTLTPSSGLVALVDTSSLLMRTPIVQTENVASTTGSYLPAGYALVFNDEFSGTSLNRQKWFTRYIYDNETRDRLNDEQQRYRDNSNHLVANGVLSLVARKVSSSDPAGINYESGMIRSDFTFRYGYMEARVRMPGGRGVWPAFWMTSDVSDTGTLGWPPEIDVFEVVNNGIEDTMNMLHTGVIMPSGTAPAPFMYADPAFNTSWTYWRAPFNFQDGWHTVGAEWTPSGVTTYVDGRKIVTRSYAWTYPDGTAAGKAHVMLNLAIGGNWAGRHGIDDSAFPQALQIDWVRVYQKPQ
jgi:beta-glucanase (GH16 family)